MYSTRLSGSVTLCSSCAYPNRYIPIVRSRRERTRQSLVPRAALKVVWVQTTSKNVLTASVECGFTNIVFADTDKATCTTWKKIARFNPLFVNGSNIEDDKGQKVASVWSIGAPEDLKQAERQRMSSGYVVMDASDWKIIPAENLVALFQGSSAQLLAVATSVSESRVMLEALEVGTAGVLLRTDDAAQVRQLAVYLRQREARGGPVLEYQTARVIRVEPLGMGDRVCVDLACNLKPGEGMLVGSFSRCLFLVHSECEESAYINSRPFRVNAGPVHAYVQAPNNRTSYLSELRSGSEVLVARPDGTQFVALVGRVKIESRPLVLVEVETADGQRHSTLLQNAETVKLVGPSPQCSAGAPPQPLQTAANVKGRGDTRTADGTQEAECSSKGPGADDLKQEAAATSKISDGGAGGGRDSDARRSGDSACGSGGTASGTSTCIGENTSSVASSSCNDGGAAFDAGAGVGQDEIKRGAKGRGVTGWRAISVAEMKVGDEVLVVLQEGARHTGIAIQESINEK